MTALSVRRAGIILLLVSLAAMALPGPAAVGQSLPMSVYTLTGYVYDGYAKPLAGAVVEVVPGGGGSPLNAKTESSGKYSVGNLAAGVYNVTATASGFDPSFVPVKIEGTGATIEQSFLLKAPDQTVYGAPLTLKGIVRDAANNQPVPDVGIEIYNYYAPTNGYAGTAPSGTNQQITARSGADGSYSAILSEGGASLTARKDGFDILHASFDMRADRTLDLPMQAASSESASIEGIVTGSDGATLANAYVYVQPDSQRQCKGDYCAQPVSSGTVEPGYAGGGSGANTGGDVSFYYEPSVSPYSSVSTDAQGHYALKTSPGAIMVSANAPDYLQKQHRLDAPSGSSQKLDFVLERIPPNSVHLHGKVLDRETGDPIASAQVALENQQWGDYNSTLTSSDGTFDLMAKPGYTILTASAYRDYYVPCASDAPEAGGGMGIRAPGPACEAKQRDRDYMPQVLTFDAGSDAAGDLAFKLPPRPAPDATFQGYVVNATNGTAVPKATVSFYNELTRDYGQAVTDADGSYKIPVQAGYYTIRVMADGYFDDATNADIAAGKTQRLDLFVQPGEKRYGGCCIAYAAGEASASKEGGAPAPMMGAPSAATATTATGDGATGGQGGRQAFFGSGGGLGPYAPAPSSGKGGGRSPDVGFLIVLGVVAGTALTLVRRRE